MPFFQKVGYHFIAPIPSLYKMVQMKESVPCGVPGSGKLTCALTKGVYYRRSAARLFPMMYDFN